jgi:hypothetical protein
MKNLSLNPDMNLEVKGRLIAKGTDAPLTGPQYNVRLFDRDLFEDDYLGESSLDENGCISIIFAPEKMNSGTLEDKYPDFFFVLYRDGELIFQSKVMQDVDPADHATLRMGEGAVIDLGAFLVEP